MNKKKLKGKRLKLWSCRLPEWLVDGIRTEAEKQGIQSSALVRKLLEKKYGKDYAPADSRTPAF